jgi:TRAP-type C4-dicarboxylate transport system permease small subunit
MLTLIRRLSSLGAWIGGALLLAVAFLVSAEVILRAFFSYALAAASEISSYVLAIGAAWGFSFALIHRAHVRVDAAVRLLPRRVLAWVDLVAASALTYYAFLLVFHGWGVFFESWSRNTRAMTPLLTPVWIPQGLWWLGLVVFLFSCVVVLAHGFVLVLRGHLREASQLIGTVTTEEEAEAEIADAARLIDGSGR